MTPETQFVFDSIDLACPVPKPFGKYPSHVDLWLSQDSTATKESIAKDMADTLAAIPAPAGEADGGCQFKRTAAFAQEFSAQNLWDAYYNRAASTEPNQTKPSAQKIADYVLGSKPGAQVPNTPDAPVTVEAAGARLQALETQNRDFGGRLVAVESALVGIRNALPEPKP